ncbi:MAG: apolipoprotein N-acyltransferase [Pseudomonadales bacterium]|nr:apolipoprotein N-acyltransferase [Pseudomonadales bacterium]
MRIPERFRPILVDAVAAAGGCLFPFSLAPFEEWPLGILSMVLLVIALDGASLRRGLLRFYLFSVGMYGVGTSWIFVSIHEHGGAGVALAGLLVVLFVAGISLVALLPAWLWLRFVRPLPLGVLAGFPVMWLAKEWMFTWLLTGFPWLFAGYGHLDTWLAGYVPIVGVMGVSFLVAAQASAIACATLGRRPVDALVAVVLGGLICIGGYVWRQVQFVPLSSRVLTVSVVQGNIDQDTKWLRSMVAPILNTYLDLSKAEWGRDLIVWPEASITVFRASAVDLLDDLDVRGKATGSTLVLGIPDRDEQGHFLNTAVAVGEGYGQYKKRRLVPFGEYVPLESWLRGLIRFFDLPMSHAIPGPADQLPMVAAGMRLSVSICYEVVYPELVRTSVTDPGLLITISNDTWFGHSIGPLQHLEMAQARALENGRYLVRGTNNGVTAIVDPLGRVVARLPQFEKGVLRGEVRQMTGTTPFVRWGSWPVLAFAALLLVVMAGLRFRGAIR